MFLTFLHEMVEKGETLIINYNLVWGKKRLSAIKAKNDSISKHDCLFMKSLWLKKRKGEVEFQTNMGFIVI